MSKTIAIIVGLILLAALLLFSMTYTVQYHEVAIKTRFGQSSSESVVDKPGLKFRLPLFADRVTKLDKRLQLRESPLETVQTADGQQIVVKAFMLWRVDTRDGGPLAFSTNYSSIEEANASLGDQFKTAMRQGLSHYTFNDLIGSGSRLAEAEQAIKGEMASVQSKGIEPVAVGVSQLVLPPRTAQAVLTRMQATRTVLSENERSRGQSRASSITTKASTQADKIRAFAEQRAADIRAQAEQDAARYFTLMNEERDLAIFLQWIDGLRQSLSRYTTVILPADFAPYHMFNLQAPRDGNGIPKPPSTQPDVASHGAPPPLIGKPAEAEEPLAGPEHQAASPQTGGRADG